MNYTASQLDAINKRGTNLLVSAAAGSGKTRVLVDRIINLITQDGISIEKMLIVTFTNAAAGEMKSRLQEGLQDALENIENTSEQLLFIREQLRQLQNAHISTMHAFCISELRRFYHVLDLDPNFKVLTESLASILKDEAIEDTFTYFYENDDEGFMRLVEAYGGKNDDSTLRRIVLKLANSIQSQAHPEEWLSIQCDKFNEGFPREYEAFLKRFLERKASELREQIAFMKRVIADCDSLSIHYETIQEDEKIIQHIDWMLSQDNFMEQFFSWIHSLKFARMKSKPKKLTAIEEQQHLVYKTLREQYKKALDFPETFYIQGGYGRVLKDRANTAIYLEKLKEVTLCFLKAFKQKKLQENGLDFNDLEHFMVELLEEDTVCEAIRQEIPFIFFDEYQDANPIQEHIISKLSTPNQLFFVGDVKQAIYRFRRADPNIFNSRYAAYRDTDQGELIFLDANFRSRAEILDFTNQLFYTLMSPSLGDVDYREKGQALVSGNTEEPLPDAVQYINVHTKEKANKEYNPEAVWIATEISRLVNEGTYGYGDIVVLMRSPSARIKNFESIFRYFNIPFYADNIALASSNYEVKTFIAVLNVIENDFLDQPLLAALSSPFGGIMDDELATIRLFQEDVSFAIATKSYMESREDDLSRKLQRFFSIIDRWRKLLQYESVSEVALKIFEESGFSAFLLGMESGEERYQNVMNIIELIEEYEREQYYGLTGFLHYFKSLTDRHSDSIMPGIKLTHDDDVVRLMSIHKSKGLGFKVVFLCDLSHRFNLTDATDILISDSELGLSMQVIDLEKSVAHPPFEKGLFSLKNKQDTLSEEVRLLYVALTRAKERLYLVNYMTTDSLGKMMEHRGTVIASTCALKNCSSYQAWFQLCMSDESNPLGYSAFNKPYREANICLDELIEELTMRDDETVSEFLWQEADEQSVDAIDRVFNSTYPYMKDVEKPYKYTVSELTKGNNIINAPIKQWPNYFMKQHFSDIQVPKPKFLQEHISFTAAEFGTLMHKVILLLPMEPKTAEKLDELLKNLLERALITDKEYYAVDKKILRDFYQGDFVKEVYNTAIHIEQEVSFTLLLEGLLIDGQIDLFFETTEGYHVVDFKTDLKIDDAKYTKQLEMYALALEKARKKPIVSKKLYWLRYQKISPV